MSKLYVPKIIVPAFGYFHLSLSSLTLLVIIVYRILNVQLGERSRLAWLGVEADPLVQSDSLLKFTADLLRMLIGHLRNGLYQRMPLFLGLGSLASRLLTLLLMGNQRLPRHGERGLSGRRWLQVEHSSVDLITITVQFCHMTKTLRACSPKFRERAGGSYPYWFMAASAVGQLRENLMNSTRIIFLGRISFSFFFFLFFPFKVLALDLNWHV